jgi:hypothetical protein
MNDGSLHGVTDAIGVHPCCSSSAVQPVYQILITGSSFDGTEPLSREFW